MPHAFGVDVASDWADKPESDEFFAIWKQCGLWTITEANILHECARRVAPGSALDIGSHTGFTTAHMAAAGLDCVALDPMFRFQVFQHRFQNNMRAWWDKVCWLSHQTSADYFSHLPSSIKFELICIDGDHNPPAPMEDAQSAARHLSDRGFILLHDAIGPPVQEAVSWLIDQGFRARFYWTPHIVAVCWRGDIEPPDYVGDPRLVEQNLPGRVTALDLARLS